MASNDIFNIKLNCISLGNRPMTAHDWSKVNSELCMTHSKIISKEAQNNRKLLLTILEQQGFINYPNEWWHFSYGDRYWAYYQSDKQAIYGSIP